MTSQPNPSWRHHHAPQFYLAKWTDPFSKKLWQCTRLPIGKLVETQKLTKSTGYEEHLYTAPPSTPYEKWAPDAVETKFMSPLDGAASRVLEKLLSQPAGHVTLSAGERQDWARFRRSLMERHPRTLAERSSCSTTRSLQRTSFART